MKSDEDYRKELQKCVLCGSCKADCPTYFLEHSEARGPRGRLRLLNALFSGELDPTEAMAERLFSCLLCGACAGRCSAGLNTLEALCHGRGLLRRVDRKGNTLRRAVRFVLKRPDLSFRLFRLALPLLGPYLRRKGFPEGALHPGGHSLKEVGTVFSPPGTRNKKGRVVLFAGCTVNYMYPHLGESLIRVLNALDYEVVLLKREVCCGSPLLSLGLTDEAGRFARRNVDAVRGLKADAILSLCPTCVTTLRKQYEWLAGESIDVVDTVTFLSGRIGAAEALGIKAAYHDPCHALHGMGQYAEPRELLRVLGVELVDVDSGCCGLAGTFSLTNEALSKALLERRLAEFEKRGAEMIVTSCPGCFLQLSRALSQDKVFHTIEVVEEGILK